MHWFRAQGEFLGHVVKTTILRHDSRVRLLHTSDWHLGLLTGHVPRTAEHEAFFSWLLSVLREREVDVLVVAGDVFDGIQPSNEATRLYFGFLRELLSTGVRDAVIVGGNHDSPAHLDAPHHLLQALSIHVLGGYLSQNLTRHLIPLHVRGETEPSAVCLAVPFIHEYRLGVRTTDSDTAAVRCALAQAFQTTYQTLCDRAEQTFPGLPLIATGHLTMGPVTLGEAPQEIHQVGRLDPLPLSIFDPRIAYVALGHIHRAFPVERGRLWYSGSPIPLSAPEMAHPRRVLLVELDTTTGAERGPVTVEPIEVPISRRLLTFRGTEARVTEALRTLEALAPLPPLVSLTVELPAPDPQLRGRLRELCDSHPARPQLVELRECLAGGTEFDAVTPELGLAELTPEQVFLRVCETRGAVATEPLLQAFRVMASSSPEAWVEFCANLSRDRGLP